ncbi:hypothetical protein [Deinococcus sedimenti]|uniref:hypothetical protein n=1 Tax=Deinococcus sedimenti TaxID=1867090 RepID=UPI001665A52F|nr:hypothetical protein [Deinococcus sedimenti]
MKTGVSPEITARFMALRRLAGDSGAVDQLPPVDTFRHELRKFYDYREEDKPIVLSALTYLESPLSLTAEIMSAAPDAGISILEAFVRDYPGVPGSNLAGRWSTLTEACLALHRSFDSKNVQGMWESSKNIHLNFNEFLNGLLPFTANRG